MQYATFASPLMKSKTVEDCVYEGSNWYVVLNHFVSADFILKDSRNEERLKMVWFSQNVNYQRGLEQIIPVLKKYEDSIELTLIGNRKEKFYKEYIEGKDFVKYLPPMDQKSLHLKMSEFDVGLAIEPGKDKNNFIALANKLITYFQSGLFILASDTPAHIDFFNAHPQHGIAVSLEEENLPGVLDELITNMEGIRSGKIVRFENAKGYCWETESEKLKAVWESVAGKMIGTNTNKDCYQHIRNS